MAIGSALGVPITSPRFSTPINHESTTYRYDFCRFKNDRSRHLFAPKMNG
jgi:hypothetical protein